jgi:hypothetical protein
MDTKTRDSQIVFLVLTFALSSIFYVRAFGGVAGAGRPSVDVDTRSSRDVTQLVFHRTLAGLGWRVGPWLYLGLALPMPIAYCLVIYVPVWLTRVGRFDSRYIGKVLPLVPMALASNLLLTLGEEIAWRAFLAATFYPISRLRLGRHRDRN